MKHIRTLILFAFAVGLSACASVDTATRNLPIEQAVLSTKTLSYTVKDVRITVPRTLRVSEANVYYPLGDIVWREDRIGNRYEQIEAIFEEGMTRGVADMKGSQLVYVDIEVKRFHSMSEKARYSVGGVHSIKFVMTVVDAKTGAILVKPRLISADLDGFGGRTAIEAERRGQTQKVRITDHLTQVIRRELLNPPVIKVKKNKFNS